MLRLLTLEKFGPHPSPLEVCAFLSFWYFVSVFADHEGLRIKLFTTHSTHPVTTFVPCVNDLQKGFTCIGSYLEQSRKSGLSHGLCQPSSKTAPTLFKKALPVGSYLEQSRKDYKITLDGVVAHADEQTLNTYLRDVMTMLEK
jgi:hypothetical protein